MNKLINRLEEILVKEELTVRDCDNALDNIYGILMEIREDSVHLDVLEDREAQYIFRQLQVKCLSKGYGLPIKIEEVNLIIKENKPLINKMIAEYKLVC